MKRIDSFWYHGVYHWWVISVYEYILFLERSTLGEFHMSWWTPQFIVFSEWARIRNPSVTGWSVYKADQINGLQIMHMLYVLLVKNAPQIRPCEGENSLTFALWFWSGNHSRHKVHADNNVVCALRNVFRQLPFGWLPVWRSFFQRRTLRIEEAVDAKSLCLLIALWECDTHFHWYCLCEGDITSIHFVL